MTNAARAGVVLLLLAAACGDDTAATTTETPASLTVVADLHHSGAYIEGALALLTVSDEHGVELYRGAVEHRQGVLLEGSDRSYPVASDLSVGPGRLTLELELRGCTLACPDPSDAWSLRSDGPQSICSVDVDVVSGEATTALLHLPADRPLDDCELRARPVPWEEPS